MKMRSNLRSNGWIPQNWWFIERSWKREREREREIVMGRIEEGEERSWEPKWLFIATWVWLQLGPSKK